MVSTHLKNISEIGSFPRVGVKIKNIWNHHLATKFTVSGSLWFLSDPWLEFARCWLGLKIPMHHPPASKNVTPLRNSRPYQGLMNIYEHHWCSLKSAMKNPLFLGGGGTLGGVGVGWPRLDDSYPQIGNSKNRSMPVAKRVAYFEFRHPWAYKCKLSSGQLGLGAP